jgi:3-methyladenine DNA glycosylase/8-oxoguanine DNA glycosylase
MGKDSPPSQGEAIEYSRRWSPFRSYVTSYLFAAARSGQNDLLRGFEGNPSLATFLERKS